MRTQKKGDAVKQSKNSNKFFKESDKELARKYLTYNTEIELKKGKKKIEEWAKKNNYILLDDEEDIVKVFGSAVEVHFEKKRSSNMFFYIWKYSGMRNLIETEEETDYVNSLSKEEILKVEAEMRAKKLLFNNYVVSYWGDKAYLELSKNGTIAERIKSLKKNKEGELIQSEIYKPLWIHPANKADKAFVKRQEMTINQLPVSLIKEILKK